MKIVQQMLGGFFQAADYILKKGINYPEFQFIVDSMGNKEI